MYQTIFFIFLISACLILNYVRKNVSNIEKKDLKAISAIFITLFVLYGFSLSLMTQLLGLEPLISLKIAFVFSFFFFYYHSMSKYLLKIFPFFRGDKFFILFLYILTTYFLILSNCNALILNISLLVFLSFLLLELTLSYHKRKKQPLFLETESSSEDKESLVNFKRTPNVYYLLVDAYGRQDTLKEIGDFDNFPFLYELEKKGFIVSKEANANYHFTLASLSATMNMAYHPSTVNKDERRISKREITKGFQTPSRVLQAFKQNGYKILNYPGHWCEVNIAPKADIIGHLLNYEIYRTFLEKSVLHRFNFFKKYINFKTLTKSLNLFPSTPKFTFVHFADVHDVIYDEKGNLNYKGMANFSDKEGAHNYINSIKHFNNKLLSFIETIIQKDPNSIIIIQSDHGPWLWRRSKKDLHIDYGAVELKDAQDFKYYLGVLSAVYLPEKVQYSSNIKEYLLGTPSLINTFRLVFSYLSDQKIKLLPEQFYFLKYENTLDAYKVHDITNLEKVTS